MSNFISPITYGTNACARDKYVLGTCRDHSPRLVAPAELVFGCTVVIRIAGEKADDGGKRGWQWWCRLVVRRFGLQHAGVDVCRRVQVVLIEDGVLGCRAIKPSTIIGLSLQLCLGRKENQLTK